MISKDDALNIAILAALVAFLAWAVPSRMAEHHDATIGASGRGLK